MHWERSYFAMNKPNIAVASLIYGDPGIPGFNYTNAVLRAGGRPFMVSNVDSAEEAQYIYDHFDGLLLTGGCADPYGWKAVRSSMGAVFRRPIYFGSPEELAALLHRSDLPLYGAALREDTVDARQADYTRCVLAIGSEGRGLSREVLDLCDQTIRIPMSDRCESLNAAIAAAVLLWESWR